MTAVTLFFRIAPLIAVALLVACAEKKEQGTAAPRPALTVTAVQPLTEDWPIRILANGTVEAWQEAVVGSELQAERLAQVLADVGDTVKAGKVLAVFDDASIKIDVAQAKAALAQAQSAMEMARDDAERATALRGSGAMSDQNVVQYLSAEKSARAQVDLARASLAAQELRLVRTRVRAPDDGVISARSATVGAVPLYGGELFRLVRKGRLEWRAVLTDVELERITPDVSVQLTLADGRLIEGSVRMVAPTLDVRTRTGFAYVDLPPDSAIRPGMFARGEFQLGIRQALTVPSQAVTMHEAFSYVFRLEPPNSFSHKISHYVFPLKFNELVQRIEALTVHEVFYYALQLELSNLVREALHYALPSKPNSFVQRVKVTTGRRVGDRVEVLDGLEPDSKIVLTGTGFLSDGDLVRVVSE